ncbi:SDR family NAD(P)-dependent oxidoreductase [Shewanella sp.]|uniref:SDR family NAD(P)-dependent oxidoreductase n=1 Tax=Shewanella sp. TaxID=50422 RepID=UPI0040549CCE
MYLITGASSGLGAALAHEYAQDGHELYLTGRDEAKLAQVTLSLSQLPLNITSSTKSSMAGSINTMSAELNKPVSINALLDSLPQAPEVVFHCAGSGYFGPLAEQTSEGIINLVNNNLTATLLFLRELIRRYQDLPIKVVVVLSTAALQAKAGESSYCAVKWAIKGLIESLRLELKGKPLSLIAVYPGGMATEFWQTSGKALDTTGFMSAAETASMIKHALMSTAHGYVSDLTINRR